MRQIFIILFILIGLFFLLTFYQNKIKNFFYSISLPFEKGFFKMGRSFFGFLDLIKNIKEIKTENQLLKTKNNELLSQLFSYNECQKENQLLKRALEIKQESNINLILAEIIFKDPLNDSILINKGLRDGIKKDLIVITPQKILVGKVDEVYDNFSQVALLSNPKVNIPAQILNSEKNFLIVGKGNGKILLDLVDLDIQISPDDVVFTSSSKSFPKGLLIGKIKEVKKTDVLPCQQAEVEPFFDIKETDKVFVIEGF
jgi:rod shape-determining protein MreC